MTTVVRVWAQEAIAMDKAEQRHDEVLEKLVKRLAPKKGCLSVKEFYFGPKGKLHGEMDLHYFRKVNGTWHHRYYEVKSHYSDGAEDRAIQQFERHKEYHQGQNWKYILVTPEVVKRVK